MRPLDPIVIVLILFGCILNLLDDELENHSILTITTDSHLPSSSSIIILFVVAIVRLQSLNKTIEEAYDAALAVPPLRLTVVGGGLVLPRLERGETHDLSVQADFVGKGKLAPSVEVCRSDVGEYGHDQLGRGWPGKEVVLVHCLVYTIL
jgi:hypothetical protein